MNMKSVLSLLIPKVYILFYSKYYSLRNIE